MNDERSDPGSRRPAQVRTHLANERTYLAWTRTGLASIALGLAAAELLSDDRLLDVPLNRVIAMVLIGFGMVLAAVGRARYRSVRAHIEAGTWSAPRRSIELVTIGVYAVGAIAIVFSLRALAT